LPLFLWELSAFLGQPRLLLLFSFDIARNNILKLAQKFCESYCQIGYFIIPASFLIFILRQPIVDFLYYHGQFSHQAALLTSASVGLFCLGIYFSSIMPLLFRLFFATRDTASPTWSTITFC